MFFALAALLLNFGPFLDNSSWNQPSFKDTGSEIVLHVHTETRHAMCPLIIEEMKISHPTYWGVGILELKVITDPNGICLWAFGPHSGTFRFAKHTTLQLGDYEFWLNGTCHGILHCKEEGSYLGGKE